MLNKKTILLIHLLFVFSTSLWAQKSIKLCGEYIYYAPENVTLEQAKQTALERAKLEALAEKFGTILTQNNATVIKNENGKSDVQFLSLGGSEVKGEWIETTQEPAYQISYEKNMLVVKVSVCGKAREIVGTGIDFTAKILRNGTETKYESDEFKNGDDLYLFFQSPVSGYLAVYLLDDTQTTYCLLPYMRNKEGRSEIKQNQPYIFFSAKHAEYNEQSIVDEYTLTTTKHVEHNQIYIIFSPTPFTKANDHTTVKTDNYPSLQLPRELPFEDFQKWLAGNRNKDKDMKVEVKNLIIKR